MATFDPVAGSATAEDAAPRRPPEDEDTTGGSADFEMGQEQNPPVLCQQASSEITPNGAAGARPPSMLDYLEEFRNKHMPAVVLKKPKKQSQRSRPDIQRFLDMQIPAMQKDMQERGLLDGPEYAGCFFDLHLEANGVPAVRPAIDNIAREQ